MDFQAYTDYFEDLATKSVFLQHTPQKKRFCRINIEEVLSSLRSSLDLVNFCLVLESFEGQIDGANLDQLHDNQVGAFMILKNCRMDDFSAENAIYTQAKTIGLKIVGKLFYDAMGRYEGRAESPLKNFDPRSVKYEKVGPIFDHAFGFRFEFTFHEAANAALQMQPADWLP